MGAVDAKLDAAKVTAAAAPAPLRALEARRLLDLIGLKVIPALAAGLIAYLHIREAGSALIITGAMFIALQLVERRSWLPLELMPAARFTLALFAPLLGAGLALLVALAAGDPMPIARLEAPVVAAWLVLALGAWIKGRFDERMRARVAVIGSPEFAADLREELAAAGVDAYDVVGWFGREAPPLRDEPLVFLGGLRHVRSAVIEQRIELLVCARADELGPTEDREEAVGDLTAVIADACLDLPVRMIDANQLYEDVLGHVPLGTTDSAWFRYIMHPRFRPTPALWERCFDLVIVALIAVVAVPMMAVAAIAIKLSDGGSVFYRQRRVGERGREFKIVKLRTMVPNAEAGGPQWCSPADGRVTRLGRFLRRAHIDELPQLWNVVRGEMRLVGPRPERPEITAQLERVFPYYQRRHLVRPGITGWAQLRCGYAGSELGTAWKLCHDLFYVKRRSLLANWLIIVETAFEAGRDAHRALRAPTQRFIVGEAARE